MGGIEGGIRDASSMKNHLIWRKDKDMAAIRPPLYEGLNQN